MNTMNGTPQQNVELFHLLFLAHLRDRVDPSLYALKGGCNLRFYFKSVRYSEDIDLDVHTVAKDTLKNQVSKLLFSDSFAGVLRTKQLQITEITAHKQTDTVQRWKLKVSGPGSSVPVPSKIEFSRRPNPAKPVYQQVDPQLTQSYALYPVLCNHYERPAAVVQKIQTLPDRDLPQARDVFDLDLLFSTNPDTRDIPKLPSHDIDQAIETALSISYDAYKAQVVAYIAPEYQEAFGTDVKWNQMQERVTNSLSSLKEQK
jgi:predicted nucleotidyltransferase component of viral defense system